MKPLSSVASVICLLWMGQALAITCPSERPSALASSLPVPEWQIAAATSNHCISVASVVARERERAAVSAQAASATPTASSGSAAGYVPKTKDDNTPWRFDMNQNGRRMTADEFDAWMKAKGIRVATGKPVGETVAPSTPACTASATTTC